MFKGFKFFKGQTQTIILVAVSISMLIGFGALWALNQPKQTTSWVKANQVVPERILAVAIQQNYEGVKSEKPMDKNQIQALKVPDLGGGNLYVIDFNSSQLCGHGGCLYVVYTQQVRAVLSLLLNPNLPKGTSLLSISEATRNGFSCLEIAQSTGQEKTVALGRYCYEGMGFTLVNSSVTQGGV